MEDGLTSCSNAPGKRWQISRFPYPAAQEIRVLTESHEA